MLIFRFHLAYCLQLLSALNSLRVATPQSMLCEIALQCWRLLIAFAVVRVCVCVFKYADALLICAV